MRERRTRALPKVNTKAIQDSLLREARNKKPDFSRFDKGRRPVVVIGGGPTGAAAAMVALEKGYPVLLINKYPPAVRRQRIKVNKDAANLFERFAKSAEAKMGKAKPGHEQALMERYNKADKKFLATLKANKNTVSVAAIERFWRRQIYREQLLNDSSLVFVDGHQGSFEGFTDNKEQIKIKLEGEETREMNYAQVVDGTGTARVALTEFAKDEATQRPQIAKEMDMLADPLTPQGTAIFFADQDSKPPGDASFYVPGQLQGFAKYLVEGEKFTGEELNEMENHFLWFDQKHPPRTYIICNKEHTKFYVGGEVPPVISNLTNEIKKRQDSQDIIRATRTDLRGLPEGSADAQELKTQIDDLNKTVKKLSLARRDKTKEWFKFILKCQFKDTKPEVFKSSKANIVNYDRFKVNIVEEFAERTTGSAEQAPVITSDIEKQAAKWNLDTDELTKEILHKAESYMSKHGVNVTMAIDAITRKYALQVTSFELRLSQTDEPLRAVETTDQFVIGIGDAIQSPNFHKGHGVVDAMRGVKAYDDALPKAKSGKAFHVAKMNKFIDKVKGEHSRRMETEVLSLRAGAAEHAQRQQMQSATRRLMQNPLYDSSAKGEEIAKPKKTRSGPGRLEGARKRPDPSRRSRKKERRDVRKSLNADQVKDLNTTKDDKSDNTADESPTIGRRRGGP